MGKVLLLSVSFSKLDTANKSRVIFSRTCRIVLKNNIFEFDEITFKQKRGTTIGTRFVPPYAVLSMADLEENMLETF